LLWTVSGIYFAFNKIEMVRGEQYRLPLETEYRMILRDSDRDMKQMIME